MIQQIRALVGLLFGWFSMFYSSSFKEFTLILIVDKSKVEPFVPSADLVYIFVLFFKFIRLGGHTILY